MMKYEEWKEIRQKTSQNLLEISFSRISSIMPRLVGIMQKQPFLMENTFIPRLVGEWFLKVAVWHWVKPVAPKTSLWLLCSLADCCMLFAWVSQIRLANHWAAVKLEKVETGNGVCSPSKLCLSTFTLKVNILCFCFVSHCSQFH